MAQSFLNNVGSIGTLLQGVVGLTQINRGANLQLQGAQLAAGSFRTAGVASMAAANYNTQLVDIDLSRKLDAASRQLQRVLGEQTTQAAITGFQSGSKSFLAVMNETLDSVDSQVRDLRTGATQRKASILFEGQAAQVNYENQARQAEYQGEVAAYQSRRQFSEGLVGVVNQGMSLLGNFFND